MIYWKYLKEYWKWYKWAILIEISLIFIIIGLLRLFNILK